MKNKFILSLVLLFSLLKVSANSFIVTTVASGAVEVTLSHNDIPFDILTTGEDDGYRSVLPSIPFFIFLDVSNHSIELDFLKAVGEVEIIISQNGAVIYSSLDNIISSMRKFIQLSSEVSGDCLIEVRGGNGAYAYGYLVL